MKEKMELEKQCKLYYVCLGVFSVLVVQAWFKILNPRQCLTVKKTSSFLPIKKVNLSSYLCKPMSLKVCHKQFV